MSRFIPRGMGWIPDLPDPRDYTFRHKEVLPLLKRLAPALEIKLPDEVNLCRDDEGEYFPEAEDQGPLNASAAFAVLGLVEYFERRVRGRTLEASKRFLHQVTRNVRARGRRSHGDIGADLRTTLKVLTSIGVPAEEYWPYSAEHSSKEPGAFEYNIAERRPDLRYFRLDEPSLDGNVCWQRVTSFLASGFPICFGFSVPTSLTKDAVIPYRGNLDGVRGGQAAVAVGYRHHRFGRGQHALLIRSSWGPEWGDNGNGWLPVAFLRHQLAKDFWTAVSEAWLESPELSCPTIVGIGRCAMRSSTQSSFDAPPDSFPAK